MKRLLLALLLSPLTYAADEIQVFACQETNSEGLSFENGRWGRLSFRLQNYLLKIEGTSLTQTWNDSEWHYSCSKYLPSIETTSSCISDTGGWLINFNPENKKGGMARLTEVR